MRENEKRRRKPLTLHDKWRIDGEILHEDNPTSEEEIKQNIEKLIKSVNNNIKKGEEHKSRQRHGQRTLREKRIKEGDQLHKINGKEKLKKRKNIDE